MDRQQIGLKLALERLGLGLRMESFEQRLIRQKAVYLAQAVGLGFGYYFRWYLRGPYSSDLTRDLFGIQSEIGGGAAGVEGWTLDELSGGRLERIRDMIPHGEAPDRQARTLELLASSHYLIHRGLCAGGDAENVEATLCKYGKVYSSDEVRAGLEALRSHGLLGTIQ